jgi:hypothetical protein
MGDVNRDGNLDLVLARGTVNVMLGRGDGTFEQGANYDLSTGANAIAMGDVDDDGSLDLVVADQYSYSISLLMGFGDGTFHSPIGLATCAGPTSLALAAQQGPGMTIIIACANNNKVRVLPSESRLICGP